MYLQRGPKLRAHPSCMYVHMYTHTHLQGGTGGMQLQPQWRLDSATPSDTLLDAHGPDSLDPVLGLALVGPGLTSALRRRRVAVMVTQEEWPIDWGSLAIIGHCDEPTQRAPSFVVVSYFLARRVPDYTCSIFAALLQIWSLSWRINLHLSPCAPFLSPITPTLFFNTAEWAATQVRYLLIIVQSATICTSVVHVTPPPFCAAVLLPESFSDNVPAKSYRQLDLAQKDRKAFLSRRPSP